MTPTARAGSGDFVKRRLPEPTVSPVAAAARAVTAAAPREAIHDRERCARRIYSFRQARALSGGNAAAASGACARCRHRFGVWRTRRSEEHTSELQSLRHLVCRLVL